MRKEGKERVKKLDSLQKKGGPRTPETDYLREQKERE